MLFSFLFQQLSWAWQVPQGERDVCISWADSCYDYHPNFQTRAAQQV